MSYIGQIPLPQATEERIERTATAGQTSFTGLTYVNGHISIFINGVKLDNSDFTATDGTTVTLGTGAAAGDTVSFVSTTQTSALVALPLKDSAGNNILSESSGVVTLNNVDTATIGSNALVVDSSANVGIGTSSPYNRLSVLADSGEYGIAVQASAINLTKGYAITGPDGSVESVFTSNAATGEIKFGGLPANYFITYYTSGSERMRIDGSGNLLVGTTSTTVGGGGSGAKGFRVDGNNGILQTAASGLPSAIFNRTSNQGNIVHYRYNGTTVGSISTNTYSLPSDRDFKKDIRDLNFGLELVKKLKPKTYRYKIDSDDSPFMTGLVAQDLEQSLLENGVAQNESWLLQYNENVEQGNSKYELDYSKLIPVLIKAVQEQQTVIDALTARIETLETT